MVNLPCLGIASFCLLFGPSGRDEMPLSSKINPTLTTLQLKSFREGWNTPIVLLILEDQSAMCKNMLDGKNRKKDG